MSDPRGVYFIANDHIFDQAIAFLNSFRYHNPVMPLCLIPFDADYFRVAALWHRYGFIVWQDEDLLGRCDALSSLFHHRPTGHYRKFAIWSGPFERFVYIDCDTVMLGTIDVAFGFLDDFDVVTAFSDDPGGRRWVWKDSMADTQVFDARQLAFAANTGFLASRRAVLPIDEVLRHTPAALRVAEHMELLCYEQPLMNFMILAAGLRYTSLIALARTDGCRNTPIERWAGEPGLLVSGGQIVSPTSPPTLFMHWAGQWNRHRESGEPLPYHDLWAFYRWLR